MTPVFIGVHVLVECSTLTTARRRETLNSIRPRRRGSTLPNVRRIRGIPEGDEPRARHTLYVPLPTERAQGGTISVGYFAWLHDCLEQACWAGAQFDHQIVALDRIT